MEYAYWQVGQEALYLAGCALHGQTPQWDPAKDLTALYQFCKFHSITAIVAMALEDFWKDNPPADPEIVKPWKQAKEKAIRKNILLNAEREEILRQLEEMGCWYMPLKGSLLQHDYPKFGMRQMSDNDILIDENYRAAVHDLMRDRGYEAKWYNKGVEDEYLKPPVYNFEMHTTLFIQAWKPKLAAYYENVRDKMVKDASDRHGYHLTDEDFYIYLVAHGLKHDTDSGTGVRYLLDVWVYTWKHPNLNWDYIARELQKFGAADFERQSRELSRQLLDIPGATGALTEKAQEMLLRMMRAGTYGTSEMKMEKELGDSGKLSYLWSRMFPTAEHLAIFYPVLLKHRWLLPFIWIRRLLRAVFVAPGKAIRELKTLKKL